MLIYYHLIFLLSFPFISACSLENPDPSLEIIVPAESCQNTQRFLNPDAEPNPSETDLDRYFRLAFNSEVEGNFSKGIAYYQKAADIATCNCDQKHALAGKKAAQEAEKNFEADGLSSKPTQYFWGRLQELTQALPCVQIQE